MGQEYRREKLLVNINKIFLKIFSVAMCGNLNGYKCTREEDARRWRTSVINTKKPRVGSKIRFLIVKMLKIRKKCLTGAFFLA